MLENRNSGGLETTSEKGEDKESKLVAETRDTVAWRLRDIPVNVRDAAKKTARMQNKKLADFVADAIVSHVGRIEATTDNRPDDDGSIVQTLEECIARIKVLENFMASLKTSETQRKNLPSNIQLKNLVERPWLRDQNHP